MILKTEAKKILDYQINDILEALKKINTNRLNHDITYSKNIFLPLTHICQNNCGYCTFKQNIDEVDSLIMTPSEVELELSEASKFNCTEALYTFGENADSIDEVSDELQKYEYETMVDYVYNLSKMTLDKYGLLPHTNMGIISRDDLHLLGEVNASMGLMLETTNKKLLKTIVHKDSPGKDPKKRLKYIKDAGKEKIPFTTGLLIGIGERKKDHINSLFKIRELQDKYGHIQEIIIQNFKPKHGIAMENYPEPELTDLVRLVILATFMFPDVSIQIPPNLTRNLMPLFIICGADDLGGVSPVSMDFVNPDAPWPEIKTIKKQVNNINYNLKERLCVYDKYITPEYLSCDVYNKAIKLKKRI